MIHIAAAWQSYKRLKIPDMGLRRSAYIPSEEFTKRKKWDSLEVIFDIGSLDHSVKEWVIRRDVVYGRLRESGGGYDRSNDELDDTHGKGDG